MTKKVQIRNGPGSPIGKNTGSDQNTKRERKKIIIIIVAA
jgi:hypothetical protein